MINDEPNKEIKIFHAYLDKTVIKLCNHVNCQTKTPHIHDFVSKNNFFKFLSKIATVIHHANRN